MDLSAKTGAVEGCLLLERKMEAISNNLANVGTCSFKKACVSFQEILARSSNGELRAGKAISANTDFAPGETRLTGNPLDLALEGPGFFKVETPEGTLYTRNGGFSQNTENVLVTSQGYPVLGQGGPINVKGSNIQIDESGVISADQTGDGKMTEVGRISIVNFEDPSVLEKVGDSFYRTKDASAPEAPASETKISQGYLEQSNINPVQEMVEMIQIQRNYELYRKVIQSFDELESRLFNEVGRLS